MKMHIYAVPCKYRDGMVIVPVGQPAIEEQAIEVKTAAEVVIALNRMFARLNGSFDAKIFAVQYGRKVAGYDARVKAVMYRYECHASVSQQ